MRTSKLLLILVLVSLLAAIAFAATEWRSPSSGTEKEMTSSNYKTQGDVVGAGGVAGPTQSTRKTIIGFLAGLFGFGDTTLPTVAEFKIDGKIIGDEVRDGDYIDKDAEITATVTDNQGINTAASRLGAIELPGGTDHTVTFDQAGYDSGTGSLSYTLDNLADGEYEIKIEAVDTTGNSTDPAVTVNVDSTFKALNPLVFPNPYNPDKGDVKIDYQFTQKPTNTVEIFVFNSFNQLVYRRAIPVGSAGARVGYNSVYWNGIDNFGKKLSPGIYFVKITSERKLKATIKMAVLR